MHYAGFIGGHGAHGYRTNVRSAIKRIRIKFHERDPSFAEIENYTAFGYCWGRPKAPAERGTVMPLGAALALTFAAERADARMDGSPRL